MSSKRHFRFLKYDTALVFLIFSLTTINSVENAIFVLVTTLFFTISYVALVRDYCKHFDWLWWLIILGYIAVYTIQLNLNFFWYFFFPSNLLIYKFQDGWFSKRFISFHVSIWASLLVVLSSVSYSYSEKIQLLVLPLFIYVITFLGKKEFEARRLRYKTLQQHQTINLLAAENERNRIGRDLHDSLGHTFAMMTLKTELALKQLEKENLTAVQKELKELNHISRQSMQEVRSIVSNLKYRSFSEELRILEDMFSQSAIDLTIDNHLDSQTLSPVLQSSLVMIVRELTNNVIKHSRAKSARLTVWRDKGVHVSMEDDGCGFKDLTGQELHSIKERLQLVKGEVSVTSLKNPTQIEVVLYEGVRE